ncbi:hypothetical protein [Acinetobacter genomosp. 15BJ]|uniref:Uncharacterized protein n=1 Tax=Acinetobacter genomosp. 15BJ TaxID=106651 RepID=R9ALV0_9GAMM|nr:hypothetical protein [Acinetobacter genomosp. 15BJ]EOR03158.1 hypothetical protein F896_03819 [Acinetobacter genomosp. 15BJ]MCH7293495.1 hypothetical protein [Acinetobacter genomosp. 15BJ]MDO3655765.1 hypothetical protein [Acinetobacter genomosp. 15BJ]
MDVLEKALLVDELKTLVDGLNDDKTSLFEIAKSKQRIKDICASCDDPNFQDQLSPFKEFILNEEFSADDLALYGYTLTYRGTYNFMGRVENALFASADMGWAALRQAQHWQVWVIRPALSFLKSPWLNSSKDALQWLQSHASVYVKTDHELQNLIPILEPIQADDAEKAANKDSLSIIKQQTAQFKSQLDAIIQEKIQPAQITPSAQATTRVKPSFRQSSVASANLNKAKPLALNDFSLDGLLCRLERIDARTFPSLYRVDLHNEIDQNIKIDWLYLKAENEAQPLWGSAQIFIAEQLYAQGQFSHYVVLVGTHSVEYATTILQAYTDQRHTRTSSIHQTSWNNFKQHYHQHETLFNECIMNGTLVWQRDQRVYPYIPASFINIQKFIPFDETAATFFTPVILLRERQKIRVIHGLERVKLSNEDQAYPYLLLDRTDGYTWQLIRQVISRLPQPISVHDLYQALENSALPESS